MRKVVAASLLAFCLVGILASRLLSWKSSETSSTDLGKAIADFSLEDTKGQEVSLASLKGKKAVVVLFLGTECPLAKIYVTRLQDMSRELADKGVVMLGIDSNTHDTPTKLTAFANTYHVEFPLLKDAGNLVADRVAAVHPRKERVFHSLGGWEIEKRIQDRRPVGSRRLV